MSGLTPPELRQISGDFKRRLKTQRVRALLVAGSGLSLEVPGWQEAERIPLGEVLPLPIYDLVGHEHSLSLWRKNDETLLVMNGRLHLYQGYAPQEVVAPVRLAALLGARILIATNAAGALDASITPGSLVVIHDHVNLQGSNPLVGEWGREFGPQFPDMSDVYDRELREIALDAATESGFSVREGIYAAVLGPSFETPAEVRMLGHLGATVVGMSTVPEVIAARHMGMKVLTMSLATNPGAGLVDRPLSEDEVLNAGREAADRLRSLIGRIILRLYPD